MEVILRRDVSKLGRAGEVVSVKDGFARNYLIPKGFAYVKTKENLLRVKKEEKLRDRKKEIETERLKEVADRISSISVAIKRKTHESTKIFGSVTSSDIQEELAKKGITVDKKDIIIDEPIKELGVYSVTVKLSPEISAKLKVWVEGEEVEK